MNQVFGSRILDGNLNNLFSIVNDIGNSVYDGDVKAFRSQELVKVGFVLEFDSSGSESVELGSDQSSEGGELGFKFVVFVIKSAEFLGTDENLFNFSSRNVGIVE
jgi:hypothetical protein